MYSVAAAWRLKIRNLWLVATRCLLASCLLAAPALRAQDTADTAAIEAIRMLLTSTQPGMEIGSIVPSPIAGLYEVGIQNGQTLYVTADARYLIPGDLYESSPEGLVNLGEERRNQMRI